MNLVTGISTAKGSSNLKQETYSYYADGNRSSYTSFAGNTVTTAYDALGRLTNEHSTGANAYDKTYTYDARGNRAKLIVSGGETVTYTYDAFGVELSPVSSDANPFRYSGEYFDAESGDYYLRARYYNPRLGRFLTEDPVRDGDNWYAYCNNNPVKYVDPSGEIAITTLILIGSAVIALVAAGATAYDSYKTTGKVDWVNTITTGLTWFTMAYTLGTTAYGLYLSYCAYKGITPVAEVKFNSNTEIGSNAASAGKGAQTNIKADNPGKQVEAVGKVGSGTVNPKDVRYMQSSIKNQTGEYAVLDNAQALKDGTLKPSDLPEIRIWKDNEGNLWTLDHRRLAAFRIAGVDEVPFRWATDEEVAGQMWMMTTRTSGTSIKLKLGNGETIIIDD